MLKKLFSTLPFLVLSNRYHSTEHSKTLQSLVLSKWGNQLVELQYTVSTLMMSDYETHLQVKGLQFFAVAVANLKYSLL